jgi:hypothetical protein
MYPLLPYPGPERFSWDRNRGTVPKSPSPTPNIQQKASMTFGQRRPDGLVPGMLFVPYLYLVYRVNGQYQDRTGTYLVGKPEIQLGTILNAGGREGEFFHRLNVSPFLKGQGSTDSRQPLCLFAHAWEQRMRH